MKITLISFDFWNYDEHIISELIENGIEANHIKIGAYKHKNFFAKIKNAFFKIFLKTNLKNKYRQDQILEILEKLGEQDQILVINPETIELKYHQEIKKHTKIYNAYLYDSVKRCPVKHLLDENLFNKVFSFDKEDCDNFNFIKTTNYNYLDKEIAIEHQNLELIYIGSIDERLGFLEILAKKCSEKSISYQFYAIGKKAIICKLKQLLFGSLKSIIFQRNRFNQKTTLEKYRNANIIIDVVRQNQTGLSFRVFESMALGKKLISTNRSLINYDLFHSKNILLLKEDLSNFDEVFLKQKFEAYPNDVFNKYTLKNWVKLVFDLA